MSQVLIVSIWVVLGAAIGAALTPATRRLMSTQDGHALPQTRVAAATGVLFGLLAWRIPTWPELLGYSVFAAIGVAVATVDLAEHRLPRGLVLPAYPAVIVLFGLAALVHRDVDGVIRAAVGMVVLPAFYLALAVASRGGVGAGDVRLAGPAGWVMAWHGWTTLAAGTLLGLLYASIAGLIMIILRRATRHTAIPFGPAMVAGALTAILIQGV